MPQKQNKSISQELFIFAFVVKNLGFGSVKRCIKPAKGNTEELINPLHNTMIVT